MEPIAAVLHPHVGPQVVEAIRVQHRVRSDQLADRRIGLQLGQRQTSTGLSIVQSQAKHRAPKLPAIGRQKVHCAVGGIDLRGQRQPMLRTAGDGNAIGEVERRVALLPATVCRIPDVHARGQFSVGMGVSLPPLIYFDPFPDPVVRAGFRDGCGRRRRGLRGNADG